MPEGSQIQSMFSGIAHRYDLLNHLLSFGLDGHWWRRMAKVSGASKGHLFLDVAAGTGDSSVALARCGARVVSTDFTFAMLKLGPSKFISQGLDQLIWASVGADAMRLPFRDGVFDGLTICYGIRNVQDRTLAYAEFLRVLKPGGHVTILEFSRPTWAPVRIVYDWYSRVILPRLGGWLSGDPGAYTYLPESIRAFPDQQSLASELSSAGFCEVRWKNMTGGITALHLGWKPKP